MQNLIDLDIIDTSLSAMRLTLPGQISCMKNSLETVGQLQPVIAREKGTMFQLLDGFKRYYASQSLNRAKIHAHIVDVDDITAKVMILSYNQHSSPLIDYEEAQIVHCLKREHLLNQEEIAVLLSRSPSWVSRRLSFIERLDPCIRTHLQLGEITPTQARELVKLPRGTQNDFLKAIIASKLTSRQTAILVLKYLQSSTEQEQAYLLKHPLEIINNHCHVEEISDCRLGQHGNRLLKTAQILSRQQHIFIGHTTTTPLKELAQTESEILAENFIDILKKAKTIQSILKPYSRDER